MIYRKDAAAIHTQWQAQIDESLEAGEGLLLEVGVSNSVLYSLSALIALERLAAERVDVTSPLLLIGGDGVAWAATLMSPVAGATAALSPAIAPFYAGADQATYLASLATLPSVATPTRHSMTTGLPMGLHALLTPKTQPGVTPAWSALPFALVTQAADDEAVITESDLWLQWLTLLVVVGLIIVALFI